MKKVTKMLISGRNDLNWYASNLDVLKRDYKDQFIAFRNSKILGSDADFQRLILKLKKDKIDTSNVLIEFVTNKKYIL